MNLLDIMAGCAFLATMVTESPGVGGERPQNQWKLVAPRGLAEFWEMLWDCRGHDMKHEMSLCGYSCARGIRPPPLAVGEQRHQDETGLSIIS